MLLIGSYAKFRGLRRHTFCSHIKEYKFRYNWENQNLYITLLENYRKQPIKS